MTSRSGRTVRIALRARVAGLDPCPEILVDGTPYAAGWPPLAVVDWLIPVICAAPCFIGGAIGGGLGGLALTGSLFVARAQLPRAARIALAVLICAGAFLSTLLLAGSVNMLMRGCG